jgi:hypothetical protein
MLEIPVRKNLLREKDNYRAQARNDAKGALIMHYNQSVTGKRLMA